MTMKDIFDCKNIDDLPPKLKKDVESPINLILELFKIKPVLTEQEIIVGLYRKYNVIRTKIQIRGIMYRTNKLDEKIKRIDRGKYQVI